MAWHVKVLIYALEEMVALPLHLLLTYHTPRDMQTHLGIFRWVSPVMHRPLSTSVTLTFVHRGFSEGYGKPGKCRSLFRRDIAMMGDYSRATPVLNTMTG
jgi:sirohydrochlorin ferrochelatase